jgi:hypothetical protein
MFEQWWPEWLPTLVGELFETTEGKNGAACECMGSSCRILSSMAPYHWSGAQPITQMGLGLRRLSYSNSGRHTLRFAIEPLHSAKPLVP